MTCKLNSANIDLLLKIPGAVIAALYVLGLLISNLHFMELGISDFPSLNPQNVLVGVLFALWLGALMVLWFPLALFVARAYESLEKPNGAAALAGIVFQFVLALAITVLGALLLSMAAGYFLPWGLLWRDTAEFDQLPLGSMWEMTQILFQQVLDVYWHPKVITAIGHVGLLSLAIYAIAFDWKIGKFSERFTTEDDKKMYRYIRNLFVWTAPISLLLLISGYAVDVFPNLRSNLGGRQPQIVELSLRHVGMNESKLFLVAHKPMPGQDDEAATSVGPVAVWHRSDKFLYVMPLPLTDADGASAKSDLIAIDADLVKTMRHVRKYVRVGEGSRIIKVGATSL